jgi:hypothetical protein
VNPPLYPVRSALKHCSEYCQENQVPCAWCEYVGLGLREQCLCIEYLSTNTPNGAGARQGQEEARASDQQGFALRFAIQTKD